MASNLNHTVFTKTDRIQESVIQSKPCVFNKVMIDKTKIKILEKLDTNKACGPDNVGIIILKKLSNLMESVLFVSKSALPRGQFPTFWETSKVVPVLKDNDNAEIEQY